MSMSHRSCHTCKFRDRDPDDPLCMACSQQGMSLYQEDEDAVAASGDDDDEEG